MQYSDENGKANSEKEKASLSLDGPERNAVRGYLQRAEVRYSTMHRVAVGFISGAGLLVLFPNFFRDTISALIIFGVKQLHYSWISLPYALLGFVFLISIFLPLCSMYFLLKDIFGLYFSKHFPYAMSPAENYACFTLMNIPYPRDEDSQIKKDIISECYSENVRDFVMSPDKHEDEHLEAKIRTQGEEMPRRSINWLIDNGIAEIGDHENEFVFKSSDGTKEYRIPKKEILRYNAALNLSGFRDITLVEEAAKTEATLVRTSSLLRIMVFRYFKSLILFIVTSLVSFFIVPFAQMATTNGQQTSISADFAFYVISVLYILWSFFSYYFVKMPVKWVENTGSKNEPYDAGPELKRFEKLSHACSIVAGVLSVLAMGLHFLIKYSKIFICLQ